MLNEGPFWWCAIFKILFKFYFFIVVCFRSLPERFYPGFFLFLVPFKTFQNERTSKTQSILWLVSWAAVFSVVTQTTGEATQRTAEKRLNCGGWRATLSLWFLKNLCFILFYFFNLLLFTVKTISRRVEFHWFFHLLSKFDWRDCFFLFSFSLFYVGVALVPRPLFKSSPILCQETLWQKGTGTNNSAREEHTSQAQSGNNLLPLAQFTRAY